MLVKAHANQVLAQAYLLQTQANRGTTNALLLALRSQGIPGQHMATEQPLTSALPAHALHTDKLHCWYNDAQDVACATYQTASAVAAQPTGSCAPIEASMGIDTPHATPERRRSGGSEYLWTSLRSPWAFGRWRLGCRTFLAEAETPWCLGPCLLCCAQGVCSSAQWHGRRFSGEQAYGRGGASLPHAAGPACRLVAQHVQRASRLQESPRECHLYRIVDAKIDLLLLWTPRL